MVDDLILNEWMILNSLIEVDRPERSSCLDINVGVIMTAFVCTERIHTPCLRRDDDLFLTNCNYYSEKSSSLSFRSLDTVLITRFNKDWTPAEASTVITISSIWIHPLNDGRLTAHVHRQTLETLNLF